MFKSNQDCRSSELSRRQPACPSVVLCTPSPQSSAHQPNISNKLSTQSISDNVRAAQQPDRGTSAAARHGDMSCTPQGTPRKPVEMLQGMEQVGQRQRDAQDHAQPHPLCLSGMSPRQSQPPEASGDILETIQDKARKQLKGQAAGTTRPHSRGPPCPFLQQQSRDTPRCPPPRDPDSLHNNAQAAPIPCV